MPLNEEAFIERVSIRHSISTDAVRTISRALRSAGAPWPNSAIPTSAACRSGHRV